MCVTDVESRPLLTSTHKLKRWDHFHGRRNWQKTEEEGDMHEPQTQVFLGSMETPQIMHLKTPCAQRAARLAPFLPNIHFAFQWLCTCHLPLPRHACIHSPAMHASTPPPCMHPLPCHACIHSPAMHASTPPPCMHPLPRHACIHSPAMHASPPPPPPHMHASMSYRLYSASISAVQDFFKHYILTAVLTF